MKSQSIKVTKSQSSKVAKYQSHKVTELQGRKMFDWLYNFETLKPSNPKRGFTLIELLITVAIGSLMLGGGIATYNNFDRKQKVQAVGRELVLALRSAQKRADSGDKPAGCESLREWAVRRVNLISYETVAVCSGATTYVLSSVKNLPQGIVFNTDFYVRFMTLTGGVVGATTIEIGDVDDNELYVIDITSAGAVDDRGFQ